MPSPVRPYYHVTGYIGTDDMTAYVTLDKKNSSIHIHFYGKMFGNQRGPILVKHVNRKFPEGDIDLVKQVIVRELSSKKVQIEKIVAIKKNETRPEQTTHPQRIIIRFKK